MMSAVAKTVNGAPRDDHTDEETLPEGTLMQKKSRAQESPA
jgi:hypothetical protein